MGIVLTRIDERLVHGQIINEWIAYTRPTHLVIVDEMLKDDPFMMGIYEALLPIWLHTCIFTPKEAARFFKEECKKTDRIFLLAKKPQELERLMQLGINIDEITLADKKYFHNKIKLSGEEERSLQYMRNRGTRLLALYHPSDTPEII